MGEYKTGTRTIIAVIFLPLLILICYYGRIPFLLIVLIIGLFSYYEFTTLANKKKSNPNLILGLISVFIIISNAYFKFVGYFHLLIIITAALSLVELFRNKNSAISNLGSTFLGILYIGLFSAALVSIREFYSGSPLLYNEGGYIILSMLASIWICDTAAFFIGIAFGKHKIFPRVSPKKSWEGSIAGFIFAVLTMIAAREILIDFISMRDAVFMGGLIGIFGQAGDFVESLFKRDAGVKDSSNLLPGHGGMFDRFDSLLMTAPITYLYLLFFT
ncbi:MAG: phosphatidate cytidylyltransferase [Ignavibacteria bacterium RBG_13_36_8]|nr:MAG: phosphatidate cytidylyltransferase [Ignavibacteria bacterium RBG_13_36_8]